MTLDPQLSIRAVIFRNQGSVPGRGLSVPTTPDEGAGIVCAGGGGGLGGGGGGGQGRPTVSFVRRVGLLCGGRVRIRFII